MLIELIVHLQSEHEFSSCKSEKKLVAFVILLVTIIQALSR